MAGPVIEKTLDPVFFLYGDQQIYRICGPHGNILSQKIVGLIIIYTIAEYT